MSSWRLPVAIKFDPPMLGLVKNADTPGARWDFLAVRDTREFCFLREANKFAHWSAVCVEKGVNAVAWSCWKVLHNGQTFSRWVGMPISSSRGEDEIGFRIRIMSF